MQKKQKFTCSRNTIHMSMKTNLIMERERKNQPADEKQSTRGRNKTHVQTKKQ